MKIAIIAGSQRANSQSLKVGQYLEKVSKAHGFDESKVYDLAEINLPFWNEGVWEGTEEWTPWNNIAEELKQADAFVFITPEWHGMATPALKNFLMLSTANELGHKPALLSSVTVSINGVYPITELRLTGSKNNHVCFLPDHLIFRNSQDLLDSDNNCTDEDFERRAQYTMSLLAAYAKALAPIHRDMAEAGKEFVYGM
ncbi:NADPH-dependent FMN reductase [Vibrio nigripulchritudo]|uniref:NADPH-dependent FMN reductase n=1 Tax=Vibrio nigripulchritudo TaxID=28173 RepID=UPI0005FA05AE|nr:NAD(P)H-dependent oxidoreductase [Vibrio nigripulchritudo]KJY81285.1 reductase [Vibrio nigripulchritudo]